MGLSCRVCGVPLLFGFRFCMCVHGVASRWTTVRGLNFFWLKGLALSLCCFSFRVCDYQQCLHLGLDGFRFSAFFAVQAVPLLSACNVCNILFVSVCHVNPIGGWFCHCSGASGSACHFIAEGLPVSCFIACTPVGIRVRRSGLLSCRVYHGFSDLGFASVCMV